jgi:hypothetical protein
VKAHRRRQHQQQVHVYAARLSRTAQYLIRSSPADAKFRPASGMGNLRAWIIIITENFSDGQINLIH